MTYSALAEDHVKLRGCVSRLSEVRRHAVTLRMLEEMSGPRVASELSLTPGNVAVLPHRAKAELLRRVSARTAPSASTAPVVRLAPAAPARRGPGAPMEVPR
jgi:DNA-directed RNA polymerase specialized sigma24 family protein